LSGILSMVIPPELALTPIHSSRHTNSFSIHIFVGYHMFVSWCPFIMNPKSRNPPKHNLRGNPYPLTCPHCHIYSYKWTQP
jgi:hypothetical protein